MKSVTYGIEKARLHWRNMLDAALSGMKVIIERYGKPTAVMVSNEKYQELEQRAALSEPPSAIKARHDANGTWVSEEEVRKSRGPLDELYQLVSGEKEWYEIIERAELRAGVDNLNDDVALVYAEIEKELEPLRQRQKVLE